MNKKRNNTANVPNLRFPRFSASWKTHKLGEVAQFSKGKGIPKKDICEEGKFECIRYGELYTHYGEVINKVISKTDINKENLIFSEENDVIIPSSGETQLDIATASCVIRTGIALGGDLNIIKTPNNGVFLSYYLNNNKKIKIARMAQGSSVVHLYSKQLASLKINFPLLEEQNMIASFLTLIDKRIQTQNKIIDNLELLKKGLLQKVFSQEIRFKNEKNKMFPKWENKKVSDLFEVTRGNVLSMSLVSETKDSLFKYPVYSSQTKNHGLSGFYKDYLYKNAITWTTDGANAGDVNYRKGKFYCTNVCGVLLSDKGYANVFIAELLNSVTKKYVSYVGNPKLMNGIMSEIIIKTPCLKEQTKISKIFSSMNSKIDIEKHLLLQLQNQKKYLLQQLFC